jgi:putative tryptophan/tyrosine transport system substrate-binding protein
MRRREFITLLGGAAAAWPLAASAQQAAMPVIGYLNAGDAEGSTFRVAAFRKGLGEAGYIEGRNVTIEYRWAQSDNARLPELAADLVRRRMAVHVTTGSTAAAVAAKAETATIPVVFSVGADPVQAGLVASLNRPGGNVTGVTNFNAELGPKRLGLLHELVPAATRFAVLVNPQEPIAEPFAKDVQAAASLMGLQTEVFAASTNGDIDTAFASLVQKRCEGLLVSAGQLFVNRRVQLATISTPDRILTNYSARENVEAGGLMSYGPDNNDQFRLAGVYAGRILKGEKPADLPVLRSAKFELVINLQTAKTLANSVPPSLLAQADAVIE